MVARCGRSWARSVWSARSLLPLSERPRLTIAPASWTLQTLRATGMPALSNVTIFTAAHTKPTASRRSVQVRIGRRGRCGRTSRSAVPQAGEPPPRDAHDQPDGMGAVRHMRYDGSKAGKEPDDHRSEEHTSELQSLRH